MIIDPLSPAPSLNAAYGLVDTLRVALTGATCPQWTGVGGDAYRTSQSEAVACALGVLADIQAALDLLPSLEAEHAQLFAHELADHADANGTGADRRATGAW